MQIQALHGRLITLVGQDLLCWNQSRLDDALVSVKIGKKHIERLHPLNAAPLHDSPLAHGDRARNGVKRQKTLGALVISIKGEGYPGTVKQEVGLAPPLREQLGWRIGKPGRERLVVRAAFALRIVHLIVKNAVHAEPSNRNLPNSSANYAPRGIAPLITMTWRL